MFSFLTPYATVIKGVALIGILVAAVFLYRSFISKHENIGYQKAVAEYTEKLLIAEKEARTKEQELIKRVGDAENEAKQREVKISKLNADIGAVNKRLRNAIENNSVAISEASRSSVDAYARTLGTVFADCTERYREMGRNAEAERSDKITLLNSWPK